MLQTRGLGRRKRLHRFDTLAGTAILPNPQCTPKLIIDSREVFSTATSHQIISDGAHTRTELDWIDTAVNATCIYAWVTNIVQTKRSCIRQVACHAVDVLYKDGRMHLVLARSGVCTDGSNQHLPHCQTISLTSPLLFSIPKLRQANDIAKGNLIHATTADSFPGEMYQVLRDAERNGAEWRDKRYLLHSKSHC